MYMVNLKIKNFISTIIIAILSVVIILEGMYLLYPNFSIVPYIKSIDFSVKKDLNKYATIVLEKCSKESYKIGCYDKEIPNLMDYISMEEAFEVTKIIQKTNPEYLYCHVLGHNLSRRETQKDPSKWMEVITRCPATMCNNGCLHGSMMDRFKAESLTDAQIEELKNDIASICEPRGNWHPVPVEISMCYHAIGHLNMYLTNANIVKSIELCDVVGVKDDGRNYVQTCTHGVFMQIFQPLEPEDFALVAELTPKKEDVVEFCEPYKNNLIQWEACRMEAWPLFRVELGKDATYMEKYCSFSSDASIKKTCLSNMMSFLTLDLFVNNPKGIDTIDTYCTALSTPYYRANCYAHTAARLVQLDPIYSNQAFDVCKFADSKNAGDECYEVLSGSGSTTYHPKTKEIHEYCGKMPEKWKNYCLNISNKIKNE